jgi:hypothetical protein
LYINQDGLVPQEALDTVIWEYGRQVKVPKVVECLESVHKRGQITSIPHYFKSLRDWVTYQDAYLLFRLYGAVPKSDLDFSLTRIAFAYSLQSEVYLIHLFGWEAFKLQFDVFSRELMNNLGIESQTLIARCKVLQSFYGS